MTLVDAAIAVRVELTTLPATLGVEGPSPDFVFDAGYVVPVVAGTPLREQRIVYSSQQFWLDNLVDQVGYKLHPGVVATITELTRGP